MGRDPGNVNEEPGKGFIQAQGEYQDSLIHIFSDQSRLDIRMVFSKPGRPTSKFPVFNAAISSFRDLATRFLSRNDLPQINRLALGVAVLKSASGLQDCGEIIKEHLPFPDDYEIEPVDFLYQFNRRRLSRTITGMNLNRLIKWSIQQVDLVTVPRPGSCSCEDHDIVCSSVGVGHQLGVGTRQPVARTTGPPPCLKSS